MVNQCAVCGAYIGELYKYCIPCCKDINIFTNCQGIKEDGSMCKNKARQENLFCIFHKKRCIYCRREDTIFSNKCKQCIITISLNSYFKYINSFIFRVKTFKNIIL